nr:MAG TPA: hypothetical protein [Caudoviricetes sp.]DAS82072.1 MAG TPA: hypothetical protein [Caudoviricetes sp.]
MAKFVGFESPPLIILTNHILSRPLKSAFSFPFILLISDLIIR